MKNIPIYYLLFSFFLFSCDTDFSANADWEETMVIYGLIDQTDDRQYIKINKAYLGEGDALQMASISDSVNYNPLDLNVILFKIKSNGDIQDSVILKDTIMNKDPGLFSTDNNIIYTFKNSGFLEQNKTYRLHVKNVASGTTCVSETRLIEEINVEDYWNVAPNYKFNFFYNQEYADATITWDKSNNGVVYQMILTFNYVRISNSSVLDTISVDWVYPIIYQQGNSAIVQQINGEEFFNFLSNNSTIENDYNLNNNLNRRALSLDLEITAGTEDLYTYMVLNSPSLGIIQQKPFFTNIDNGIGLFSSRYKWKQANLPIHSSTIEKISMDLESFNFIQ
tara:strand:- start:479 stop:1489 length:1011 start_codon:yes stop_codon:yes gene_type:complete